jgi:hypothetical protein
MKCAVLISGDEKQIFLTPENDDERSALKFITPNDDIELQTFWGTFSSKEEAWRRTVNSCQGGWLRSYSHKDSLVFLVTPKATAQP